MTETTYVLADPNGNDIDELRIEATTRVALNEACQVTHKLQHADPVAGKLLDTIATQGTPQIKVIRDGAVWARAWWNPMEETAGGDSSTLSCAWRGPFAEQEHQFLTVPYGTFNTTHPDANEYGYISWSRDQGLHARGLLVAQGFVYNGLRAGTVITSVSRDRFYPSWKQRAEAIVQLTQISGGVEFIERPNPIIKSDSLGPIVAYFDVAGKTYFGGGYPQPEFQYGPDTLRNVTNVRRELGRPITSVVAIGKEIQASNGTRRPAVEEVAIGVTPHLRRRVVLDLPDISEEATLREHAKGELRPNPPQTVTWEPDPASAPQPGVDYALGTTCHLLADDRSLQIDTIARINSIEIDTDEDGNDSAHRIETGEQRSVWPASTVRVLQQLGSALARTGAGA